MSTVDTFGDYCILREFDDENNLLIMVYCSRNNKFYQKKISPKKWANITSNFTIEELEMVFKVCIERKKGYTLKIVENNIELLLQFNCRETIKTYNWCIKLREKNTDNKQKVHKIFLNLKSNLYKEGRETDSNEFNPITTNNVSVIDSTQNDVLEFLNNLESMITQIFVQHDKKLQMFPFIAKMHEKKRNNYFFDKYVKKNNNESNSFDAELVSSDDNVISSKNNNKLYCYRNGKNYSVNSDSTTDNEKHSSSECDIESDSEILSEFE
jgi:hypothetical protein